MTKLEQAARQIIVDWDSGIHLYEAITALREALDHSGEANEMVVGWDRVKPEAIASDPLYQQGFVDGVEEGRNQVAEQAEQEPVAYLCNGTRYKVQKLVGDVMICGLPDKLIGEWVALVDATDGKHLRAAPVRTKDLTPHEITALIREGAADGGWQGFAQRVIAADREKNK